MKFTDTMSSFKYMGGSLPMHVAMFCYGWLISHDGFPLIKLNTECENDFPKLNLDDVKYMQLAHIVCISVMIAHKILTFQKKYDASYFLEFLK